MKTTHTFWMSWFLLTTFAILPLSAFVIPSGQPAPPRGHLSVWMEEARMPEAVRKAHQTETPVEKLN